MESSSGTQRRTDRDRLRAIRLLSALKSWLAYKKILRTRSKSGSFVLLGEKICIMVVLYTHKHLPTASAPQGSLEEKPLCTLSMAVCHQPTYTPGDFTRGPAAAVAR